MSRRDLDDFVTEARAVPIAEAVDRLFPAARLTRGRHEWVGPCPVCGGGEDRFGVSLRKNVWSNRKACCGAGGGDALALAQLVEPDFLRACAAVLGREPPDSQASDEDRARWRREAEARRARAEAERAKREAEAERWTARERDAGYDLWRHGQAIEGTLATDYIAARGCAPALPFLAPSRVRFIRATGYRVSGRGRESVMVQAPALLLRWSACDGSGAFYGVHRIWLDPSEPDRRFRVDGVKADKRIRGTLKGGLCPAIWPAGATRALIGEGEATVLGAWSLLRLTRPDVAETTAALIVGSLDNLTAKGRPVAALPPSITQVTLLGDGDAKRDADHERWRRDLEAAAARYGAEGRRVEVAMADRGMDWGDMARARLGDGGTWRAA